MKTATLALLVAFACCLLGCPLYPFPIPTGGSAAGGDGGSGAGGRESGGGGSGGDVTTSGSGGGGAACSSPACPQPTDPSCAVAYCDLEDECAIFEFTAEAFCGANGQCDGNGRCVEKPDPKPCDSVCLNAGECSHGYCNTVLGVCQQFNLGNATKCDSDQGFCNAKTGECCLGLQAAKCANITDAVACFGACLNSPSVCTFECVKFCPFGTSDVQPPGEPQGFCYPL